MIKVLFGCGIAVIVVVLAVLCYSLRKTAPEGKGGKAIACFVLAIVLAAICIAPSLAQYNSTSKRTVAYISKDSMTLIDESNGKATVVDLEDVRHDGDIAKGDEVVIISNVLGIIQYVDKCNDAVVP